MLWSKLVLWLRYVDWPSDIAKILDRAMQAMTAVDDFVLREMHVEVIIEPAIHHYSGDRKNNKIHTYDFDLIKN